MVVAPIGRHQSVWVYSGEALAAGSGSKGSELILDSGDECGVGAELVALVVIVLCSVILECGAEVVAVVLIISCS